MTKTPSDQFSRRTFLGVSSAAAAASSVVTTVVAQEKSAAESKVISGETTVTLNVNGKPVQVKVEPRTTLLDVLRYQLNLTGAKPVSLDASSGASTVLVDDRPTEASITLVLSVVGKQIKTVESLAGDEVPKAFAEHDASQCGFCTPGFVVAVRAFLNRNPNATEEQIRSGLNGNICRCGTYANIVQAAISIVRGGKNG